MGSNISKSLYIEICSSGAGKDMDLEEMGECDEMLNKSIVILTLELKGKDSLCFLSARVIPSIGTGCSREFYLSEKSF